MIKASELRIGNYVNCIRYGKNGYLTCIESIGEFGIDPELGYDGLNPIIDYTASFDMIEPIPLTEEWLLKFGVSNDIEIDNFPVWIEKGFGSIELSGGYETKHPLKHVHQLQNLYFALTGEELTIIE